MTEITPEQAFRMGFILKLAQERISPNLVDDTFFVLEKTASFLLPIVMGGTMAIPSLINAISALTLEAPYTVGGILGTNAASTVAEGIEPSAQEAVMRKIINDYKLQTKSLETRRANTIASEILKRKRVRD